MPSPPPIIDQNNIIFHLKGIKELTGNFENPIKYNSVKIINGRYQSIENNASLKFSAKNDISCNGSAFSVSFFAKRTKISGASYEHFGFWFNPNSGYNIGYHNGTYLYIDDNNGTANNFILVDDYIDKKYFDICFYTICRDVDNKSYMSINGKQVLGLTNHPPVSINPIKTIVLFLSDIGNPYDNSIVGWMML